MLYIRARRFGLTILTLALTSILFAGPLWPGEIISPTALAQSVDGPDFDSAGNWLGDPPATAEPSPAPVQSAQALQILCYSTQPSNRDPCVRVGQLFSNITLINSPNNIPADLSPFDVFYLGYGEGDTLADRAGDFVAYVQNGGGLIVSQPDLEGEIEVYPPGFEMTVSDIAWPEWPSAPGPVEFTPSGAAHPILTGLTPNDISGNFDTVPLSLIGPAWTVLVKSVEHPHVALAAGNYGSGRLVFHSGNISHLSIRQGSDAYVRQMIEWAAAGPAQDAGPDMRIDAIEVTQAIQDLNNSVTLIANKRTYVRVHVSSPLNATNVFANLSGERNGVTLFPTLSPGNPAAEITVRPNPNRGTLSHSYWFELPNSWTNPGSLTLTARLDPADAKNDPNRANNTVSTTVNFEATPPLKLRIFNVRYQMGNTTHVADTFHLQMLESWLQRAFPIHRLEVARQTFDYPNPGLPDVDDLHAYMALGKLLRIIFLGEDPRTFYYGMVDDGGDFMRGKALGIPGTISAGPTGATGFAWDTDGSYGDWYGAHEIAHSLNRYHAEFCGAGGGQPYPYSFGRISQDLTGASALFGFDIESRAIYNPNTWRDVMTYCANQWISDFTYEGIHEYLVGLYPAQAAAALVEGERFLLVIGKADLETNTAELQSVHTIDHAQTIPLPEPGDWTLVLQTAEGEELESYPFAPDELTDVEDEDGIPALFALAVPAPEGVARLEIRVNGEVVDSRAASENPPVVQITDPEPIIVEQTALIAQDTRRVAWDASDPDGDPLTFTVLYSHDNGETWQTLVAGLTEQEYEIDAGRVPGGPTSRVRVLASDGFLSAEDTSVAFEMPLHAPEVTIAAPAPDANFWPGQNVVFQGSAYDLEDGMLEGDNLVWESSLDGPLGTGTNLNTVDLSTGQHTIRLIATDSDGMEGEAQVEMNVLTGDAPAPTLLEYDPIALSHIVFLGGQADTIDLILNSSDDSELAWEAAADQPWITLSAASGTGPSVVSVTLDPAGLDVDIYEGEITVTAPDAENSPVAIPVTLEVMTPPDFEVRPLILRYGLFVEGDSASVELSLISNLDEELDWQATVEYGEGADGWLTLDAQAGTTPSQLPVTLDPAGLDAGSYQATLRLEAADAENSPVQIPVTLTLIEGPDLYIPNVDSNN